VTEITTNDHMNQHEAQFSQKNYKLNRQIVCVQNVNILCHVILEL